MRARRTASLAGVVGLTAALFLVGPGGDRPAAADPAKPLPPDLLMVPADAVGFLHVRLAETWNSDLFAGFRDTLAKAGPKAVAALDDQIVPRPSTLDRATVFVLMGERGPEAFAVVTFTRPVDRAAVVKTYMPDAQERAVAGKTVYAGRAPVAAHFPSDRMVLLGPAPALEAYLARPVAAEGNMKAAVQLAADRPAVLSVNLAALPIPWADLARDLPPDVVPLLKAQSLTAAVSDGGRFAVEATYRDAPAAADAEKAVDALRQMAKAQTAKLRADFEAKLYDPKKPTPRPADEVPDVIGAVAGIGTMNQLDAFVDALPVKRVGSALALDVAVPKELTGFAGGYTAVMAGFLLPAVYKVRAAAERASSSNNLKQIGLAIHAYHDVTGRFPADVRDKSGKPILSWRVLLLPYLEQAALAQQFKMDEPWDSPANRAASQTRVRVFETPAVENGPPPHVAWGLTHYVGVSGPGTMFDPKEAKLTLASVTDGLSNTAMVIETFDPVPWAKPGDYEFAAEKKTLGLTPTGKGVVQFLLGDGSVRPVDVGKVSDKTIRGMFTRAGGEIPDHDHE